MVNSTFLEKIINNSCTCCDNIL